MKRLFLGLALGLALGVGALSSPARAQDRSASESGDIALEALEPQELQPGRCGMFLWTRAAQPVLVFAAFANPTEARARTNGRNRYLRRTGFGKEMVYGIFERQTFADGQITFDIDVQFDGERQMRNGAVVKEGVIRTRDANNWTSVTPVGGMVACKD